MSCCRLWSKWSPFTDQIMLRVHGLDWPVPSRDVDMQMRYCHPEAQHSSMEALEEYQSLLVSHNTCGLFQNLLHELCDAAVPYTRAASIGKAWQHKVKTTKWWTIVFVPFQANTPPKGYENDCPPLTTFFSHHYSTSSEQCYRSCSTRRCLNSSNRMFQLQWTTTHREAELYDCVWSLDGSCSGFRTPPISRLNDLAVRCTTCCFPYLLMVEQSVSLQQRVSPFADVWLSTMSSAMPFESKAAPEYNQRLVSPVSCRHSSMTQWLWTLHKSGCVTVWSMHQTHIKQYWYRYIESGKTENGSRACHSGTSGRTCLHHILLVILILYCWLGTSGMPSAKTDNLCVLWLSFEPENNFLTTSNGVMSLNLNRSGSRAGLRCGWSHCIPHWKHNLWPSGDNEKKQDWTMSE